MNSRSCSAAFVAILTLAAGGMAHAQTFSLDVGVASQYVGKGLGKSDEEVAPFAKAEIGYGQAYANLFVSSASGSQGFDSEIVTTLGWRPEAASFALDVAAINRELPGARAGVDSNFWEYQADAARKLGPVAARLRVNYTADGFAATKEAWWVELQGTVAVGAKTKASAAVAERSADGGADYKAWNLGMKHKLADAFAIDLRWYDTDSHELGDNYDGRLVAAATYSF
jgi:uncharacterized protein (TIGR02001 family)